MRSQSLRFSISGEYLTNLSRDLVTEGEWEKAYSILASGNEGKAELVYRILLGDFCLKGENEEIYGTEDKDSKKYKEKLNYTFSGYTYFQKEDAWYRPYAYVNTIEETSEYVKERALFYKNKRKDKHAFLKIQGKRVLVLFEKIKSILPPWMEEEYKGRGLVKSVTDFMKHRHLELRGITPEDPLMNKQNQEKLLNEILEYSGFQDYVPPIALKEEVKSRIDTRYQLTLELLQNKIQAQETEWIQIEEYLIPKTPFTIWARKTHKISIGEEKEWTIICPSGLKMQVDDPIHSDWVVGAGFDPEEFYRSEFEETVLNFLFASTHRKMIVLNGKGFLTGNITLDPEKVTKDTILVIPHAGVEYFEAAKKAKAVISAIGGPGAHLVLNAKDEDIPLCLIQNADKVFKEGDLIKLSLDIGSYKCQE